MGTCTSVYIITEPRLAMVSLDIKALLSCMMQMLEVYSAACIKRPSHF